MVVGVPRETFGDERRVALTPAAIPPLLKAGFTLRVQTGAGLNAGYPDEEFERAGASLCASREELFSSSSVLLQVRALGANPTGWEADLALCQPGHTLIGLMDPLSEAAPAQAAARKGVTAFALELLPRITRAQSMDVLSSQANLAGYKAVLLAADILPRIFPMMITAAGTLTPARVFVVGAGVAGLQAIATAKRLGAVVSAYDVRPAVKEQVESVGARFVALPVPEEGGEAAGGYAKALGAEFYARQAELMKPVVAESDVVITTAAIPGERAPVLVTCDMVEEMRPGSVVVDLAAERGGNCDLTHPGETYVHQGITLIGPLNLPSTLANNASQLFGRNVGAFLTHLSKALAADNGSAGPGGAADGRLTPNLADEITRETLLTWNGEVVQKRVRQRHGLPALEETSL